MRDEGSLASGRARGPARVGAAGMRFGSMDGRNPIHPGSFGGY
jgi:hypothetical protein